ncbi:histidine phosphatase family protein [Sorangium sp. So ce131]|uniref:histidine phosphatase family protein n=1 Tax=Sorangium sp. So ce131 TaxID=3133282 RepID=UPI003F5DE525
MALIYLVRHAQAAFGAADYDQLSPLGLEQARLVGEALAARVPRVDAVVSGSMKRHRQTAEGCLAAMGNSLLPEELAGWNEYDHREVLLRAQGHAEAAAAAGAPHANPRRAFQAMFAAAAERWASGVYDAEYAESWPAFRARVSDALRSLAARLGRSQTALVFTSGGPIGAAAGALLGLDAAATLRISWTLVNGGITKLVVGERGVSLSTLNDHAHFEGARAAWLTYR